MSRTKKPIVSLRLMQSKPCINGTYPIYIVCQYHGRGQYSTGFRCSPERFVGGRVVDPDVAPQVEEMVNRVRRYILRLRACQFVEVEGGWRVDNVSRSKTSVDVPLFFLKDGFTSFVIPLLLSSAHASIYLTRKDANIFTLATLMGRSPEGISVYIKNLLSERELNEERRKLLGLL